MGSTRRYPCSSKQRWECLLIVPEIKKGTVKTLRSKAYVVKVMVSQKHGVEIAWTNRGRVTEQKEQKNVKHGQVVSSRRTR